jgi:hypothetical protein
LQGLLTQHPRVTTVGEIRRLESCIASGKRACSCGMPIADCPQWSQVIQRAGLSLNGLITQRPANRIHQRAEEFAGLLSAAIGTTRLGRMLMPHGRVAADHIASLMVAAADNDDADAIVDNSKDPGHLVSMFHQSKVPVRAILLVRDGRATVHSKSKRGLSIEVATRHWAKVTRTIIWLERILGPSRSDFIRYEDICARPKLVADRILGNAGLDTLVTPQHRLRHFITNKGHFSVQTIAEDTKWRTEMTKEALAAFERIAGPLNRSLGYH